MSWCPNCKNEYRDGIKECADCHELLVDSMNEDLEPVIFGEKEEIEKLKAFLQFNEIKEIEVRESDEENLYELFVPSLQVKKVKHMVAVYNIEKAKEDGLSPEPKVEKEQHVDNNIYTTYKDKAENYKTSAYTLIGVSVLGLLFLLLSAVGVIGFKPNIMTYLLMGGLFLIFLISGISSYAAYKKSSKEAVMENNLSTEIRQWCNENLDADRIDSGLFEEDTPDEERYFKRMEKMKKSVKDTYLNLDDGFLEALMEEVYPSIFE